MNNTTLSKELFNEIKENIFSVKGWQYNAIKKFFLKEIELKDTFLIKETNIEPYKEEDLTVEFVTKGNYIHAYISLAEYTQNAEYKTLADMLSVYRNHLYDAWLKAVECLATSVFAKNQISRSKSKAETVEVEVGQEFELLDGMRYYSPVFYAVTEQENAIVPLNSKMVLNINRKTAFKSEARIWLMPSDKVLRNAN